MRKFHLFFLPLVLAGSSVFAAESDLATLQKRIEELEKRQYESLLDAQEGKGHVRPFLNTRILFGGFFESTVLQVDGPYMESQASTASHVLGLNVVSELTDRDRFSLQLLSVVNYNVSNPHNDPRGNPKQRTFGAIAPATLMSQAYYEHRFDTSLHVQTGMGYTPFGYAYQQREVTLFKRRGGPAMLFSNNAFTPGVAFPFWMGVHIHGWFPTFGNNLGYNLYTFSPMTSSKTIGMGARLWYRIGENITFGLSGQTGQLDLLKESYTSHGADIDMKIGDFGVTLEYGKNTHTGDLKGPESYYIVPYYEFFDGQFIVFASADYVDHPANITSPSFLDPIQRWETGGGINWLPLTNVRIRFAAFDLRYVGDNATIQGQERDARIFDLSMGIAF